jgi:uncharacterized lipoprotein YddW (UPF0748 family)
MNQTNNLNSIFYYFWISALVLIILISNIILIPTHAQASNNLKGMWYTGMDYKTLPKEQDVASSLNRLRGLGFNTVFVNVFPGCTVYPVTVTIGNKNNNMFCAGDRTYAKRDILGEFTRNAGNLKVCAWFEYGYMSTYGNPIYTNNKSTALINSKGGVEDSKGHFWLDPAHPDVIKTQKNMLSELTRQYPSINCIQYDDHFGYNSEMGYNPSILQAFGQSKPSSQDPAWINFRSKRLTNNILDLFTYARSLKSNMEISISPGDIQGSYQSYLQDTISWAKIKINNRPMVDNFIVQIYRSDMKTYTPVFARQATKDLIATRAKVHIAISGFANGKDLTNTTIADQVTYARTQGFQGVALFYDRYFKYDNTGSPMTQRETMMKNL